MSRRLRRIAGPFVVAAPAGARVRTRLRVPEADAMVLAELGAHLGSLAGTDLTRRCAEGRLDADGARVSRQARKQALTAASSSRWAGAITRTTNDAWALAERNLRAERASLQARIGTIRARLAAPAGGRDGRVRGYATRAERWAKQQRLQHLQARLAEVEARVAQGRVPVCRGGRRLARARHHLDAAGLTDDQWRRQWAAQRWFITADGEAGKRWGNETIRWHPDEGWLEIKLPVPLARLANRSHGRYRLSCPVAFPHRGDQVAAQAASGAVRYDITYQPERDRWYLDASWTAAPGEPPPLSVLRQHRMLAVDLNAGHLACWVITLDGNPAGQPVTVPLDLDGLSTSARDGHLRAAISRLLHIAQDSGCAAVVIENLDFTQARQHGREHDGRRPARGRRGRAWRKMITGIPTARFRDRLVQMCHNARIAVIAADPAYTSRWAAQHWLSGLQQQFSPVAVTGHHAAAVVIGRRALGQRARRRERCASMRPEDRKEKAADSAVRATPDTAGLSGPQVREPGACRARGQPHQRHKTRRAEREFPGDQVAQDRAGPPAERDSVPLSV
jgi:hypothetical protein